MDTYQYSIVPGTDNDQMVQAGANPVPPSAADLERLRAAVNAAGVRAPEIQGYLQNIASLQSPIAQYLGQRADAMARLVEMQNQYGLMLAVAPPKDSGLTVNKEAVDNWIAENAKQFQDKVTECDRVIASMQAQQRILFDFAVRFVPSFK